MLALLLSGACATCAAPRATTSSAAGAEGVPSAPADCVRLSPSEPLQAAIDRAREGASLCLVPGVYVGPIAISRGITLFGPRDAVVRSQGTGTTVRLSGERPGLVGLTVSGSGSRYDLLDAAVAVENADGARVEHVLVVDATFGILSNQSQHVTLRGNEVRGDERTALGLRGDGIRLWETKDSVVEDNRVEHSRDLVVWYSSGNRVVGNVVIGSRYGTHLMYSHHALVERNRYLRNEVGVFVMYSHDVELVRNEIVDATGAAGMGIGAKESGNLHLSRNTFVHDTTGLYLDTTPLQLGDSDLVEDNLFALGDVAVAFHSSETRNTFRRNTFRDNQRAVRVDGGGDALGVTWQGNYWDDYPGYDFDDDGVGDVPYEPRSLSSQLVDRYPALAFFHGSPTLAMLEVAGRVVPMFEPAPLLRDPRPAMQPTVRETSDAD